MSADRRRPRSLTILAWLFFGAGLFQLLGVYATLTRWVVIDALALSVPPVYLPLRNAALALSFLALASAVWRRRRWGLWLAAAALPVIAVWGLIERLWLARSDFGSVSLPFTVFFTMVWLTLSLGLLWRSRSALR